MKCRFDNECDINMNNRHTCSFCRLKKCFANEMQSKMIRPTRPKNKKYSKKKSIIDSTSTPLVILNNKNQSEQVRIYLFYSYLNSTNDLFMIGFSKNLKESF